MPAPPVHANCEKTVLDRRCEHGTRDLGGCAFGVGGAALGAAIGRRAEVVAAFQADALGAAMRADAARQTNAGEHGEGDGEGPEGNGPAVEGADVVAVEGELAR